MNSTTFPYFLVLGLPFTTTKGGAIARQYLIMEILYDIIRIKEKDHGLCFSTCKGKVP